MVDSWKHKFEVEVHFDKPVSKANALKLASDTFTQCSPFIVAGFELQSLRPPRTMSVEEIRARR